MEVLSVAMFLAFIVLILVLATRVIQREGPEEVLRQRRELARRVDRARDERHLSGTVINEPWDDPYDGHEHVFHVTERWCLKCGVREEKV